MAIVHQCLQLCWILVVPPRGRALQSQIQQPDVPLSSEKYLLTTHLTSKPSLLSNSIIFGVRQRTDGLASRRPILLNHPVTSASHDSSCSGARAWLVQLFRSCVHIRREPPQPFWTPSRHASTLVCTPQLVFKAAVSQNPVINSTI